MTLFDKLRRSTDEGSAITPPGGPPHGGVGGNSSAVEVEQSLTAGAPEAPTAMASPISPDPGRYDPTHPRHAPVCGVDLVLFAQITQRLRVAPAKESDALLAGYGHTPETWSAVNTVWMARFGHMPYLCATFHEASRLP
jgi:hypothetical protein